MRARIVDLISRSNFDCDKFIKQLEDEVSPVEVDDYLIETFHYLIKMSERLPEFELMHLLAKNSRAVTALANKADAEFFFQLSLQDEVLVESFFCNPEISQSRFLRDNLNAHYILHLPNINDTTRIVNHFIDCLDGPELVKLFKATDCQWNLLTHWSNAKTQKLASHATIDDAIQISQVYPVVGSFILTNNDFAQSIRQHATIEQFMTLTSHCPKWQQLFQHDNEMANWLAQTITYDQLLRLKAQSNCAELADKTLNSAAFQRRLEENPSDATVAFLCEFSRIHQENNKPAEGRPLTFTTAHLGLHSGRSGAETIIPPTESRQLQP